MSVVGRLAPSPTGALHLGHAFAFLVAFWSTRSRRGRLVLRHEDVDVDRASSARMTEIEEDLRWLGIEWDERRVQSDRTPLLVASGLSLEAKGLAYRCDCSRGDLRALGAPQAGATEVAYPGTCRTKGLTAVGALRLRVDEPPLRFTDEVFGAFETDVAKESGDFVLLRKNGLPSYQLAVTVDDAFDGVTEVCRGSDLLGSVARQMLIQRALGLPKVRYFHVPLVVDEHGERLAKRSEALGLRELRRRGAAPETIVRWAAKAAGQTRPSGRADSLALAFERRAVPTSPVRVTEAVVDALTSNRFDG